MVVSAFEAFDPDTEFTVMWVSDKRLEPPLEQHRRQVADHRAYFDWVTTRTLRSAVDVLGRDHFDAVLVHLPLGDEVQAVAEFKRAYPALPVFALLESRDSERSQQAYRQGADAVLLLDDSALDRLLPAFLLAAAHRRRAARPVRAVSGAEHLEPAKVDFAAMLEAMPLPCVVADLHGQVLSANAAAQRQFHTDAQSFGALRLKSLPAAGTSIETLLEIPGGSFKCRIFAREISWHSAPALLLSLLDLTGIATAAELRQRDQQLHEYELRFSSLAEMVHEAVVLFDRKGQAIYHGPHFNRLYPGPESRRVRPQDLLEPADGARLGREIAQMLEGKSRHLVRLELRTRPWRGRHRWVEVELSDYGLSGAGEGVLMMLQRDITDRREAQEATAQATQKSRELRRLQDRLLDTIHDHVYLFDSQGVVGYLNRAAREFLGLAPGELPVQGSNMHPDDREAAMADFRNLVSGESEGEHRIYRVRDRNKSWRELDYAGATMRDEHGAILGVILTARDISEQASLRRQVDAGARQFQALIENTDLLVQILDAQGCITYTSPSWTRLTGLSSSELTGRTAGQLLHPEDRAAALQVLERGLLGEAGESHHRLLLPDGSVRFMQARGVPVFDTDGKPDGGLVINTDVTELMQESMRTVNRARFGRSTRVTAILEKSQALVFEIDRRGLLVYVNARFCEFLGRTRAELLGRSVIDFADALQRPTMRRTLARLVAEDTDSGQQSERAFITADGKRVWLSASLVPLRNAEGKATGVLVIGENTSEKLERQVQLQLALEQARSAEQARSDFLAVASHELRTPLNAMVGTLYQLEQQSLDADGAERVHRLQRSAARLKALVDDILELTRLESGQVQLARERFSLSALAQEVSTLFADQAAGKGLIFEIRLEGPDEPLLGDELRLSQALINLVGNAIKFTERGSVQVRLHSRALEAGRTQLLVEVTDSGPGLSLEQRAGLFRPFAQADRRLSAKVGGTGLGLAIVRRIAQAMDGDVGVESEPGVGSTFWLTADLERAGEQVVEPSVQAAQSPASEPVPEPEFSRETVRARLREGFAGTRVLVVEDEIINRMMLTDLLTEVGLQVEAADDGLPALERMRSAPLPALILMDMQMLELNGPQATREIRKLPGCATLPILGMSANAFAADRQACLDAGMTHFLTKPLDPDVLFVHLLNLLQR